MYDRYYLFQIALGYTIYKTHPISYDNLSFFGGSFCSSSVWLHLVGLPNISDQRPAGTLKYPPDDWST